jgi:hypothetical protein
VHPDRTATFSIKARDARTVELSGHYLAETLQLFFK